MIYMADCRGLMSFALASNDEVQSFCFMGDGYFLPLYEELNDFMLYLLVMPALCWAFRV
jgi:hypothetical protein